MTEEYPSPTWEHWAELQARVKALEAGTTCPHIVSSDEGTSYCRLAEQGAAQQEPEITPEEAELIAAPWSYIDPPQPAPAPAGSLVERLWDAIDRVHGHGDEAEAHAAIRLIAGELRAQCFVHAADWLEQEADQ